MSELVENRIVDTNCCAEPRFRLGPIFAGVVAALSMQILFTVLGVAIGTASVNPLSDRNPIAGLSYFAIYWWILSGLLSLTVGAFISGFTSQYTNKCHGGTNGLITWSVVNVLAAIFAMASIGGAAVGTGKIIGGTASFFGASLQAAPDLAAQAKKFMPQGITGVDTAQTRSQLELLLKGKPSDPALNDAFERVFSKDELAVDDSDKDALANVIVSRTQISHDEALADINKWQADYDQAKARFEKAKADAEQKAREVVDAGAKATAEGAVVVVCMLLLGALTSIFAGKLGVLSRLKRCGRAASLCKP